MLVNAKITVYHKGLNKQKLETWTRYNYDNVWFDGGKGAGINKGYENANNFECRIWHKLNNVNVSNFSIGDIVVPSHLDLNITRQQDLKDYEVYNITSIKNNTYGGSQHLHIGGQ